MSTGWVRVVDGVYAWECWRVQRLSRGWSWYHVVQIDEATRRGGVARTLREAKKAAEFAETTGTVSKLIDLMAALKASLTKHEGEA